MLMHEWLQFRDKTVRRLTEEQAEEQEETKAPEAAGDEAGEEEASSQAAAGGAATEQPQELTQVPEAPTAEAPSRGKASAAPRSAQRPRTTRRTDAPAQPRTAREVLETLQPSAEVRARLEAVLARQQRLPLDAETATGETRRPRRAAETREQLVARLLDPTLSLQETALLLGVCPTTVRRYTNRGVMKCFRTPGNQRRFKLSDVLEFMERREHGEV